VEQIFERERGKIAAVIVEPVAGNMGVVLPGEGFLSGLRAVTRAAGSLLIFDEVMTGFRVHPGGAQALYGVLPDLSVLGKVIGGGLPVGAYGGRRDIMSLVAPAGPMYQAGTLSGNPLAMSAGIATLKELALPGVWDRLEKTTAELAAGLRRAAEIARVPLQVSNVGSMFGAFFSGEPVKDWESARKSDTARFSRYFRRMLAEGVYLAPSQFEAGFVSTAHGPSEVEATLKAAASAFAAL
jgi:glutamate-1-semialdehyde 2,1-aminomutase